MWFVVGIFWIVVLVCPTLSFLQPSPVSRLLPLRLVDDDQEVSFGSGGLLPIDTTDNNNIDSSFLLESLKKRQYALQQGIGKRFVARTQKGFLNIHYEPTNPHDTNNVVGQLHEGQIVTSTGPIRGFWVPHDGGGWSVSKYGGFTWLEPIEE